jgi:hypothetical protein
MVMDRCSEISVAKVEGMKSNADMIVAAGPRLVERIHIAG